MFKNNAGGHLNHSLFWTIMGPEKEVDEKLVADIVATYSSLEEFKKMFSDLALKQFGSGWAFLARDEVGKLVSYALPNQDSPFQKGHIPVFGLDVWEHAYYLRYQNRRADYISAWWKVFKLLP
jgi:Fe-Mn family superoxide dismutase